MTNYRIVYQLSYRTKTITIPACSPMEAFKKFKEMMPKIVYNNLSLNTIEVDSPPVKKQDKHLCLPCSASFDKLKVVASKPVENYLQNTKVAMVRPPAEYSNNRKYDLI